MKKVILHACCAPCALYPIQKLLNDGYRPVVFYFNPNIFPFSEYEIRRNEIKNYCFQNDIEFFEDDYDIKLFYEKVKGFENEPEKGKRCSICFDLRLRKTALFALKQNIDCFTTTLSVSPHKNSKQIFEIAKKIEQEYNVKFLEYDFKKQNGFLISRKLAKQYEMYAQTYCGCEFSIR